MARARAKCSFCGGEVRLRAALGGEMGCFLFSAVALRRIE